MSSYVFRLRNLCNLNNLEIGSGCFSHVDIFKLDRLDTLMYVNIGTNSFTETPENHWNNKRANNKRKSAYISNCENLRSISIDRYSFSDFGGQFHLYNLNSLISIKIGSLQQDSNNFLWSSFIIRSNDKDVRVLSD